MGLGASAPHDIVETVFADLQERSLSVEFHVLACLVLCDGLSVQHYSDRHRVSIEGSHYSVGVCRTVLGRGMAMLLGFMDYMFWELFPVAV